MEVPLQEVLLRVLPTAWANPKLHLNTHKGVLLLVVKDSTKGTDSLPILIKSWDFSELSRFGANDTVLIIETSAKKGEESEKKQYRMQTPAAQEILTILQQAVKLDCSSDIEYLSGSSSGSEEDEMENSPSKEETKDCPVSSFTRARKSYKKALKESRTVLVNEDVLDEGMTRPVVRVTRPVAEEEAPIDEEVDFKPEVSSSPNHSRKRSFSVTSPLFRRIFQSGESKEEEEKRSTPSSPLRPAKLSVSPIPAWKDRNSPKPVAAVNEGQKSTTTSEDYNNSPNARKSSFSSPLFKKILSRAESADKLSPTSKKDSALKNSDSHLSKSTGNSPFQRIKQFFSPKLNKASPKPNHKAKRMSVGSLPSFEVSDTFSDTWEGVQVPLSPLASPELPRRAITSPAKVPPEEQSLSSDEGQFAQVMPVYENLPLRVDAFETSPKEEKPPMSSQTKEDPIYVNLPLHKDIDATMLARRGSDSDLLLRESDKFKAPQHRCSWDESFSSRKRHVSFSEMIHGVLVNNLDKVAERAKSPLAAHTQSCNSESTIDGDLSTFKSSNDSGMFSTLESDDVFSRGPSGTSGSVSDKVALSGGDNPEDIAIPKLSSPSELLHSRLSIDLDKEEPLVAEKARNVNSIEQFVEVNGTYVEMHIVPDQPKRLQLSPVRMKRKRSLSVPSLQHLRRGQASRPLPKAPLEYRQRLSNEKMVTKLSDPNAPFKIYDELNFGIQGHYAMLDFSGFVKQPENSDVTQSEDTQERGSKHDPIYADIDIVATEALHQTKMERKEEMAERRKSFIELRLNRVDSQTLLRPRGSKSKIIRRTSTKRGVRESKIVHRTRSAGILPKGEVTEV